MSMHTSQRGHKRRVEVERDSQGTSNKRIRLTLDNTCFPAGFCFCFCCFFASPSLFFPFQRA